MDLINVILGLLILSSILEKITSRSLEIFMKHPNIYQVAVFIVATNGRNYTPFGISEGEAVINERRPKWMYSF